MSAFATDVSCDNEVTPRRIERLKCVLDPEFVHQGVGLVFRNLDSLKRGRVMGREVVQKRIIRSDFPNRFSCDVDREVSCDDDHPEHR